MDDQKKPSLPVGWDEYYARQSEYIRELLNVIRPGVILKIVGQMCNTDYFIPVHFDNGGLIDVLCCDGLTDTAYGKIVGIHISRLRPITYH